MSLPRTKRSFKALLHLLPIISSITYRLVQFEQKISKYEDLTTFGPTLISASYSARLTSYSFIVTSNSGPPKKLVLSWPYCSHSGRSCLLELYGTFVVLLLSCSVSVRYSMFVSCYNVLMATASPKRNAQRWFTLWIEMKRC